jgi:hypothetical protein
VVARKLFHCALIGRLLFTCRKPLQFLGKPGKLMELEAIQSTVLRHCSLLIRTIRACPLDVHVRQAFSGPRPGRCASRSASTIKRKSYNEKSKRLSPLHNTAREDYILTFSGNLLARAIIRQKTNCDWRRHLIMIIYHVTVPQSDTQLDL